MVSKIAGLAAGLLLLAVLAAAGVQGALTGLLDTATAPSASAQADIPADYLRLYQDAATMDCPGLDWTLLAGIGKVESDHGRSTAPGVTSGQNPAGAGGPMQFLAPTFAAVLARHPLPPGGATPPSRYHPADAIHAAADYLCDHTCSPTRPPRSTPTTTPTPTWPRCSATPPPIAAPPTRAPVGAGIRVRGRPVRHRRARHPAHRRALPRPHRRRSACAKAPPAGTRTCRTRTATIPAAKPATCFSARTTPPTSPAAGHWLASWWPTRPSTGFTT